MADAKKPLTPKSKPSERRTGAAGGEQKEPQAAPTHSVDEPPGRIGRGGGWTGPAGAGSVVSVLSSHLVEPWRSIALASIPFFTVLFYKYSDVITDWITGGMKGYYTRSVARKVCKGIEKTIFDFKKRQADPSLDPEVSQDLSNRINDLEKSLTDQQQKANIP